MKTKRKKSGLFISATRSKMPEEVSTKCLIRVRNVLRKIASELATKKNYNNKENRSESKILQHYDKYRIILNLEFLRGHYDMKVNPG